MITQRFLANDSVLLVKPRSPLSAEDFERLAAKVDPVIAAKGQLEGLVVDGDSFHGWQDLAGLAAHVRFVHGHHKNVRRVAAVGDRAILSVLPFLTKHFTGAEVRHFPAAQREAALTWAKGHVS